MLVAYVLVALLLVAELTTFFNPRRSGGENRDRGSRMAFQASAALGFVLAFNLPAYGPLGAWAMPAALPIFAIGFALRVWAIRTLGRWFTLSVQVSKDQPVVEAGPYRWMRHPSYTGLALMATGVGLARGNLLSLALVILPALPAGLFRVHVEETALADAIGEPYRDYMRRVKRFIPFVL